MLRIVADHAPAKEKPHPPLALPQTVNSIPRKSLRGQTQSIPDSRAKEQTTQVLLEFGMISHSEAVPSRVGPGGGKFGVGSGRSTYFAASCSTMLAATFSARYR